MNAVPRSTPDTAVAPAEMILWDGVGASHRGELPKLNLALLERAVEFARYSQDRVILADGQRCFWRQTGWIEQLVKRDQFCGTACCLAGFALLVTGNLHRNPFTGYEVNPLVVTEQGTIPLGEMEVGESFLHAGQWVFGLTEPEARALFDAGQPVEAVEALAESIARSRGLLLGDTDDNDD